MLESRYGPAVGVMIKIMMNEPPTEFPCRLRCKKVGEDGGGGDGSEYLSEVLGFAEAGAGYITNNTSITRGLVSGFSSGCLY